MSDPTTSTDPVPRDRPYTVVFLGQSADGFIARPDGTVDFLDTGGPPDSDMGFGELIASVDALVMGRNTFEFVADAGVGWPYDDLRVVVVTTRGITIPDDFPREHIEVTSGAPAAVAAELRAADIRRIYLDGGAIVADWLRCGLVDELVLTSVPVLIGDGIRPVGELVADVELRHRATEVFGNGAVQSRWTVER